MYGNEIPDIVEYLQNNTKYQDDDAAGRKICCYRHKMLQSSAHSTFKHFGFISQNFIARYDFHRLKKIYLEHI